MKILYSGFGIGEVITTTTVTAVVVVTFTIHSIFCFITGEPTLIQTIIDHFTTTQSTDINIDTVEPSLDTENVKKDTDINDTFEEITITMPLEKETLTIEKPINNVKVSLFQFFYTWFSNIFSYIIHFILKKKDNTNLNNEDLTSKQTEEEVDLKDKMKNINELKIILEDIKLKDTLEDINDCNISVDGELVYDLNIEYSILKATLSFIKVLFSMSNSLTPELKTELEELHCNIKSLLSEKDVNLKVKMKDKGTNTDLWNKISNSRIYLAVKNTKNK